MSIFFDSYVCIGPRAHKHPAHPWRLEHVLEDMRQCSISGALVGSQLSVSYDPMHENQELSRLLEPHANLYPIWNVMPHHTGEFPQPPRLLSLMARHDVRAVTLHPRANGWDLLARHNSGLLAGLERERMLTFIKRDQFGEYRDLEELLIRYPRLPVVLTHLHWGQQRFITPLLQTYPNLHLMFSHYQAHYGLEFLVELGCENQLLYGSNAPEMSMGAHRAYIDYADLPEDVRTKIAGGNLVRLLKGQGPAENRINPDEDSLMRNARLGKPQQVPVVDMHAHILHEGLHGGGGSYTMRNGGPAGVLKMLRRLGCDGAGLMSWSVVSGDAAGGNEAVKAALDALPDTFWGLASFDPTHYSQEEIAAQLKAVYADARFKGIKPYCVFGVRYDHPAYNAVWEFASEHGLYALLHRIAGDFSEVDTLAARFPDIQWVVAHCGSDYKTADQAIECARKHDNVYLEVTLTPVPAGMIEYLVEGAGEDKVLYGSDLPMRDPRQQLGWVIYSRLSEETKARVLGGNAEALLKKLGKSIAYQRQ